MNTVDSTDLTSRLVSEIFPAPEYDEILLSDPRFRWVVKRLYTGREDIATLRDLVDLAVADTSIDNQELEESLRHLLEFMREQVKLTLEDELFSILSPLVKMRGRLQPLLHRLGWAGKPQTTLQEAADAIGITRERVRQIQGRVERQLLSHHVWTPTLDRAVRIIQRELPLSEREMGSRLRSAGLARTSTFSAEGLLKAIELFVSDVDIELVSRHGSNWLVDPKVDDQLAVVTEIRSVVQKGVSNQGILGLDSAYATLLARPGLDPLSWPPARFRNVVEELEGYEVIDGTWILHQNVDVRNPLVNRLHKILSVCPYVSLDWAVYLLRREYRDRRALDVDAEAVRAFVQYRPEFVIEDEKISASMPEHPSDALSDSEQVLSRFIIENSGTATFRELEEAGKKAGLQKITVAVTLRSSPIFFKPDYNAYRTIGRKAGTDVSGSPQVLEDQGDDEIDAAIEQAHLPETDPVFEETDAKELGGDSAEQAPAASPTSITTTGGVTVNERETGRIRRLIKQLLKRDGLVTIDAVAQQYGKQYRPVTREAIVAVARGTTEFVVIDDQLVTSLPRNGTNPLAAGLRKMLTWLPALPTEIAVRQFLRDTRTVTGLTEERLVAYIAADDEFGLEDGVIVWKQPALVSSVMSPEERVIAQVLRDLPEPIGLGVIHNRLGLQRHQVARFNDLFLNSVLVEEVGKRRYRLVGAEYRDAIARQEVSEVVTSPDADIQHEDDDAAAVTAVVAAQASADPGADGQAESATGSIDAPDTDDLIDEGSVAPVDAAAVLTPSHYGSTETTMITLNDLIASARDGRLRLPEIQREYVWKSTQVRSLLDSLYRRYPIGNMLIWQTSDTPVSRQIGETRSTLGFGDESVSFLLDGQQRLTSLQRLLDHNEPDIRFNPFTEEFRAATATVRRSSQWIPVHTVLTRSIGAALRDHGLDRHPEVEEIERRLERLKGILTSQIPVNRLHHFDYEAVTDIFVRVNSQGTRLRTAELAVANLAFQLPGIVSRQLAGLREELGENGWDIDTMVLLRMLNAIVTGQSSFRRLASAQSSNIEASWPKLVDGVHRTLCLIRERLGVESVDWLPTINALVVPVAYLAERHGAQADEQGLIDWFVRASIFGRYTGPTETRMNQDLRAIASSDSPFRQMTTMLRGTVGTFRITLADLQGASWQSPLSLLFWLTLRHAQAVDLWAGTPLNATRIDAGHDLVRHQIFSRRAPGVSLLASQANELSNFALLAQDPDILPQNAAPAQWLREMPVDRLESQLIPTDPDLWQPANARRFIEHRRRLLARGMNETLLALASSGPSDGETSE